MAGQAQGRGDRPEAEAGRERESSGRVRTIADLARLAGVSGATVSRALRDSPLVKRETRERIQALARHHGFRLNMRARQLRLKRTDTVAIYLLIGERAGQPLSDPFLLELLGVIGEELAKSGYDLLLSRVEPGSEWWDELLHPHRFDGAIIFGQASDHERLNAIAGRAVPFVVWGGALPDRRYDLVGSDNVAGARAATAHLISCGCRRIAFLGDLGFPEVALRWQGFAEAHRAAGLAVQEGLYHPTRFTAEAGAAGVRDLLADGRSFDAVFAASDMIAIGAINALADAGRRVPEDVAVVGFDDIPLAAHLRPALTTVRQNVKAGGEALVALLLDRLRGQAAAEPRSVLLPTTLVVRQSSLPDGRGGR
ncbi:MAG: LacI family transcriptional regulator [Alphaproteobacteria bacterium]|nr:MAG: LacI family transcriptional regulator [Alphaproteobacteria bacterium]